MPHHFASRRTCGRRAMPSPFSLVNLDFAAALVQNRHLLPPPFVAWGADASAHLPTYHTCTPRFRLPLLLSTPHYHHLGLGDATPFTMGDANV